MAGKVTANTLQLGDSTTATQNFVLQTNVDGSAKLARGNAGATTQDILTVDSSGNVAIPQSQTVTGTLNATTLQQGGVATGRMVLATAQNSTSVTLIDFTGIPSWVKRIVVMFNGVSSNGTSPYQIQVGSGSIVTTGYASHADQGIGSGAVSTTGLLAGSNINTANTHSGITTLALVSANAWVSSGTLVPDNTSGTTGSFSGGRISLAGVLDRLRITTVNGTDTFDAGSVNIQYEG